MTTDADLAREFTAAADLETPNRPTPLSDELVFFLARNMMDEIMELTATVSPPAEAKDRLVAFINESKDIQQLQFPDSEAGRLELAAEQADAMVDAYYYGLNAACRHGLNLSAVFHLVHQANMAKRDPVSGTFLRTANNKIIKPDGWAAPDVVGEMRRQHQEGSFHADSASDCAQVREFTSGAGADTPDRPQAMEPDSLYFLAKMMLDEIMELTATVAPPAEAKARLIALIGASRDIAQIEYADDEDGRLARAADQADALVDSYYYSLSMACRHGLNLSALFPVVHGANMAKRDPVSGQFLRREDGKIIKPPGWQPPDVVAEIRRQDQQGAFSSVIPEHKLAAGHIGQQPLPTSAAVASPPTTAA